MTKNYITKNFKLWLNKSLNEIKFTKDDDKAVNEVLEELKKQSYDLAKSIYEK